VNSDIRTKWLIYTVLIGVLPILLRLLLTTWGVKISLFSISDFVAFGFVLHISILNEIEHVIGQRQWKTFQNGISIAAIFIYGSFSCVLMLHESGFKEIDLDGIKVSAYIAAFVSLLTSLSVFFRPNRVRG